jgi:hypothetical protein
MKIRPPSQFSRRRESKKCKNTIIARIKSEVIYFNMGKDKQPEFFIFSVIPAQAGIQIREAL